MNNKFGDSSEKETSTRDAADVPVFNNVTEHYQTIMGVPGKQADLKSMPGVLRWFGYFFYAAIVLGAFAFVVSYFMNR
ncbi:hypothetical protein [Paenibacillus lignilyticus]|uniref:Uncharacterized protein n=1 Tax=Paenibacillus lignilyticus TaxID=1172615 RepID=A0ABS5CAA6_9BACL|nr:hypothetical protein [Paenibacillus lignilyticus]MBP3962760.1 hypothetical protein [Paenibacillus lignilyticus]